MMSDFLRNNFKHSFDARVTASPGTGQQITIPGNQDIVVIPNTFTVSEAGGFNYDNTYVTFNGDVVLKTQFSINVSVPSAFGNGYLSESSVINFSNIVGVTVS